MSQCALMLVCLCGLYFFLNLERNSSAFYICRGKKTAFSGETVDFMCVSDVDLYHVLLTRQEGYRVVSWTLFLFEGSVCG